jgi:hypothetical protein
MILRTKVVYPFSMNRLVLIIDTGCVLCAVGTNFYTQFTLMKTLMAVPSLRQLFVGLSPRRPVFDSRPVLVRFVVDKVTLGQGLL